MMKYLIFLAFLAAPLLHAQAPQGPNWPVISGAGAPLLSCQATYSGFNTVGYGQIYNDSVGKTQYICGVGGWWANTQSSGAIGCPITGCPFSGSGWSGGTIAGALNYPSGQINVFGYAPGGTVDPRSSSCNVQPDELPLGATVSISATGTTLTASSGVFIAADAGMTVVVAGAGPTVSGVTYELASTIATYVSATQVTLSTPATNTVSGAAAWMGHDNTATLNSCIAYSINNGKNMSLPTPIIPNAHYLITDAIGPIEALGTRTSSFHIFGDGVTSNYGQNNSSVIDHALSSAYAAVDFTNCRSCGLHQITVQTIGGGSTSPTQGNSQATESVLSANCAGNAHYGDKFMLDKVTIFGPDTYCPTCAGLAVNTDEALLINPTVTAASTLIGADSAGFVTAPVMASKACTVQTSGAGITHEYIYEGNFLGTSSQDSVIFDSQNGDILYSGGYVNRSYGGTGTHLVTMVAPRFDLTNIRTEDVAGGNAVSTIYLPTGSYSGSITGFLNSNTNATGLNGFQYSSGGSFSGTGTVTLSSFNNCTGSTATLGLSSGTPTEVSVTSPGTCTGLPTTASCASGTATCSGTVTLTNAQLGSVMLNSTLGNVRNLNVNVVSGTTQFLNVANVIGSTLKIKAGSGSSPHFGQVLGTSGSGSIYYDGADNWNTVMASIGVPGYANGLHVCMATPFGPPAPGCTSESGEMVAPVGTPPTQGNAKVALSPASDVVMLNPSGTVLNERLLHGAYSSTTSLIRYGIWADPTGSSSAAVNFDWRLLPSGSETTFFDGTVWNASDNPCYYDGATLHCTGAATTAQLPVTTYCGTTGTCSPTTLTNPLKLAYGKVTLAGGTATVTGIPAFTSTTNMSCSCEDTTAPLQACNTLPASTSSVTVSGNATDTVKWSCWGN